VNNFECLLNIENAYEEGRLLSACFINDNNNNVYISICNYNCVWNDDSELIKVLDFNGNVLKKINKSNEMTFFIDSFYDKKNCKIYILTGNKNYVKSYDYEQNKLFHEYYDEGNDDVHSDIIIFENKDVIRLIDSCYDGCVRIWNFHTGFLIDKIKVSADNLRGLCLWNEECLLVGSFKNIKLIELNNMNTISDIINNDEIITSVIKIDHPLYGKCLITQGSHFNQIKIWGFKNA
jgi:WD40 repeat protein